MKRKLLNIWSFLKELYEEFNTDNCFQQAAALSYYTLFSLAPMCIIVISVAGLLLGEQAIRGEIQKQIGDLIGPAGASSVQGMIESAYLDGQGGVIPTVIGAVTLFLSATLAFTAVQDSLNKVWNVEVKEGGGILQVVLYRIFSFAMVLGIGFLLIVSLIVKSLILSLNAPIERILGDFSYYIINVTELILSLGIITILFALMFKFLPDVKIRWKDVWIASAVTALLFSLGKYLISWQIGNSDLTNTYGAAASIVAIILWINYSALIFFIGAEFLYVYVRRKGWRISPNNYAQRILPKRKKSVKEANEVT